MKRSVLLLLVLIVAAAVAFVAWRDAKLRKIEYTATLQSQVVELDTVRQLIGLGPVPSSWAAGAYLSNAGLNRALGTLEGVQANVAATPKLIYTLKSATDDPMAGSTRVALTISA